MNYAWLYYNFFFFLQEVTLTGGIFWKSSANTHTDIQVKKERPRTMYMWVYVHVTVCRCVGVRLSRARRGSAMGYVISLFWYPFGLATLSQMTWWQSCKANKETSATNQSFFSTTGAKNMTKSNNGVVRKTMRKRDISELKFKMRTSLPSPSNSYDARSGPDSSTSLYLYPRFLQLWRWS